ncbi:MAG TPA: hypothetical protein VGN17_00455 [Bryobacteraceae bacterium]|jgi:hypothetical protein
MGIQKFKRGVVAPSFTPALSGIPLADLAHGTDGQIPVAQTSAATTYRAVSGDVTMTSLGATTIGAGKVTKAKMKVFTANSVSGTGSAQNVAHGLGTTPTFVIITSPDGGTLTYGTHDGTNVKFTAGDNSHHFDVIAFA